MDQTSPADEVNPLDALDVTPASALTSGPTSDPTTDPDRPPPMPKATQLSGQDEKDYRAWLERIGMTHAKGGNVDEEYNGRDYDLRGFFDKYGPADINVKGGQHFTDEFKLPNHRTFSDQSKYATGPYASYAGKWDEADNYYWGKKRYHEGNANPLDALDEADAKGGTASAMRSALEQTGDELPEVTISARGGPEASWSDVGSALSPTIGAKIESKLAGVEEYTGTEKYDSARKKLWQSMVLPEAVRNARDKGIPLTEDEQVIDIARHLGIRPDQFTRDWPTYANQSNTERRDFQAAQRERIQDAQPSMEEGGARRRMASQVSEGARPNLRGVGLKSVAFDTATMIPDLLAGTFATLTTGPIGGAAFMAADIAPDEYSTARNEGLDHRHASTYALLSTLASSVPEIPVFKILDSAPAAKKIIGGIVGEKFGATAGGRVVGTTVAQGVTQATVQALQEGIDSGLLDRTDTLPDALKKIAAAGLTGAVAGVPMGGLHAAQHRLSEQGTLEADLARTRKKYPPKPTVLRDIPQAGEAPPADANGAGTMPFGHESNPVQGNGAGTANPEANVPRGTSIAPDAPVSPHRAAPVHQPELAGTAPVSPVSPEEADLEPVTLSGPHLRAALEAVDAKTISPPLLEALERMKLATRNDVNVPRLLPAGRRELAKAVPEPEQQPVTPETGDARNANIPPERAESGTKPVEKAPEVAKTEPEAVPEVPKPAKVSQIKPKRARPAPVEPDLPVSTPGNRYVEDPELRDALASMKGETGWAQVGGRVLRNEETGVVTGRTTWIPNAEWWKDRPKGLTEPQVHAAVDKALAGEKLSPREQKMVEFMRDVHDERQKLDPFLPEHADMPHDLELDEEKPVPIDAAHETALVARLAEVDEGALESYAKQHEDDRQGFLRAVKAHLDAHDSQTAGAGSESRQETTGVAEEKKGLDLFGQDTSRQQSLADETRRRDEKRSPNKDISADTGRAGDLFSTNANRQMDLTAGHRHESTHSASGHNVGDIVRIDSPGNEHHGERARILSLHRWRADEPFIARVGHEQGGQQTLELNQIKPSGQQDLVRQLEQARKETNTEPTEAQKLAGNYKKGTVSFGGMTVAIENPRGSTRAGQSAEGKTWRRKMHADYGYVKGTEGHDGDAVDVFLTGHPDSGKVFVINQNHPDGSFDEHKAILGASNKQEAEATYLKHYPKGWKGLGSTEELSTEDFKEWVNSKEAKQPLRMEERRSDYETRKRVTEMTPEELRKELLTHELTGIPNRRAYVEAEKLPTQVSIDVDSLKWVNDNMGHESGNIVLKAIADSLSQHSEQVFHLSGDEFALQALHEREANDVMAKVAEQLKGATIEVEMPDGKIVKLNGLGVSYGVGKDLHEADAALQSHKDRREKEGHRAPRGEAPPGAIVGAREEGGKDKTGGVAEEKADLTRTESDQERTAKRLGELLEAAIRRHSMEEQGQDLLDDMEEHGIHPRDVSEQFWKDTYWKLNGPTQRKFQRYLKALGFEPGSTLAVNRDGTREVAKDWHDVAKFLQADLPEAEHLEGIDRGYVALMRWANQQAAGLSHGGDESLMLKEDAAKYSPLSNAAGGVESPRVPVAPGQRSLDLFAPRQNPTPATRAAAAIERAQPAPVKGAPSSGKNRTALVRTGHFTSGTHNVRDWRDAAHILAPLRKEPRESLMAVVLDSAGRPLAIIRHTTGTTGESLLEPHTLFGAIARVPGARAFYLGHNHPSGVIDQSNADILVAKRMHTLSRGSGIDMKGSLVVAPGNKWSTNYEPANTITHEEPIRPQGRAGGLEVPIQERRLTRVIAKKDKRFVRGADDVLQVIRESNVRSGVLMLDNRNNIVGVLPITSEEMVKLRTSDPATGTARILREFESANANQAITFGDIDGALNNLGGMLKLARIDVLDTVTRDKESGQLHAAGGGAAWEHFFSKGTQPGKGMAVSDLERVVHQTIRESGLGANFPHVQVHGGVMTLPHELRKHVTASADSLTQGIYDAGKGEIHLLASNIHSEAEARNTLWHEAVGHHGLRAAMDPERYNEVMDGLYRDMPERVRDAAYRNGLDLNDPTERRVAAEEVIAYAAGQHLSGQEIDKPILPWYTQAVRAVKAFFAKLRGKAFYDDKAIAGLIQEAHTALERGTSFNGLNEGAARSQHAERFYSPVERVIGESKQGKASAEQWMATIKKMAGVKPEELEWLGLEPWLKAHDGPITKAELQGYIAANRLEVKESTHSAGQAPEPSPDERKQTALAERLRAAGHLVTFYESGDVESFFYSTPPATYNSWARERLAPVYKEIDVSSPREVESLPPELQEQVQQLLDVSDRVATERQRVAAAPNGWATIGDRHNAPQYEDYTLSGGKDYHELLLHVPVLGTTPEEREQRALLNKLNDHGHTAEEAARYRELRNITGITGRGPEYRSGHFKEPNIIAHTRFKEREGLDGKRVLFLEEVQSDWHQTGRKHGYRDEAKAADLAARNDAAMMKYREALEAASQAQMGTPEEWRAANRVAAMASHAQQQIEHELVVLRDAPPQAPFKTTWPMLAMKRMIRWAAEHGFERIAWTTGEQQAERYGLEKHVKIEYVPKADGQYWVHALDVASGSPVFERTVSREELDGIVGREVAQKIAAGEGKTKSSEIHNRLVKRGEALEAYATRNGNRIPREQEDEGDLAGGNFRIKFADGSDMGVWPSRHSAEREMARMNLDIQEPHPRVLEGEDLKVGGEGMRGFYDDILPRETNKLIKKFGARVEDTRVRTGGVIEKYNAEAEARIEASLRSRGLSQTDVNEIMSDWTGEGEARARAIDPAAVERYAKDYEGAKHADAHGFDITPDLRDHALSQGFPLFAKRQAPLPLQQPGPKGFYERVRKAVDWMMENKVSRDFRKLGNPVGLSADAKEAARVAREYLGSQAAWGQRSQEALEHFAREIDKWPIPDQLEMMDRIEQGLPQAHPELQAAADGMRKMLDDWRDKVRGLGIGALDNFIENYFPHYWADPDKAKRLVASIQGRRPLKGPASFLKRRTIPTIKEGMDAGLKPLTVNPLVMTLLKTREMQRFITGVTLMKRFKEDGLAVFLKSGAPMPDGWAPINDSIAKVRSWSDEEGGWIERGQYIMPEDAARVINNHVSQSWLKSFAPAQAFRVGANLLNALQLGFSAFHLGFTTLDAIISKTALGMESMLHGEIGKAVRNFGEVALGPIAAVNNVRRGYNLLQAYTNPIGATPELAKIVKGLEVAGGRAHMDKYYMLSEGASPFRGVGVRSLAKDIHSALTQPTDRIRNVGKAVGNFAPEYATKLLRGMQALGKTHTAIEIPFEVAGRLVRASTSWIMEHLVPMQKLGVFADLAKAHMDRHPNENPNEQADSLQRIWASVDNRLGEMVYDNLFWNRTFKDVLHFGIRAVGWNVGTVREIGGAPFDVLSLVDKAIRTGKITADDVGHKIPYVLAMTMTTALYGAILNYLFTGEGPKELKDYFFPRTGGETNYGTPQRVSLPSYVKDVYEYSQRPGHTVMNKLNPIFNVIGEMWSNEDFFGNPITDPDAGFWKSLEQRGQFVAGEAKPFSLQGAQQLHGSEKPGFMGGVKTVAPYVGISPAPGYVTSPDQMERRERSEREKKYASHLKYLMNKAVAAGDKDEIARLRKEYTDAAINVKKTQVEVDKDKARSAVSRRKAATSMRQQGFPATASLVASLPLEPDAAARQYFREQAPA